MNILATKYPHLRMHEVCRMCWGNSLKFHGKDRCSYCKRTASDWRKAGFVHELENFEYLHKTWYKAKIYNQITTGIHDLDFIITVIFGQPHTQGWRDYRRLEKPAARSTILRGVAVW